VADLSDIPDGAVTASSEAVYGHRLNYDDRDADGRIACLCGQWREPDDFFKGVHELAGYFYRGPWTQAHEPALREAYHGPDKHVHARGSRPAHTGEISAHPYQETGTRMVRSVIKAPSVRGGIHPTQKPVKVVDYMLRYAVPTAGLLLSPFGGSCTDLWVARSLGMRAVGIEGDEAMCEKAARWLDTADLFTRSTS
jgi:site-specific DNA-methyltransferase (adenine-specific)